MQADDVGLLQQLVHRQTRCRLAGVAWRRGALPRQPGGDEGTKAKINVVEPDNYISDTSQSDSRLYRMAVTQRNSVEKIPGFEKFQYNLKTADDLPNTLAIQQKIKLNVKIKLTAEIKKCDLH